MTKIEQRNINHINRSIISNEIEAAIKNLPKKKSPGPLIFTTEFYQTFKELISIFRKPIHKIEREGHC
jgi:hypothetical protein